MHDVIDILSLGISSSSLDRFCLVRSLSLPETRIVHFLVSISKRTDIGRVA
jgi:hypothetical protein